MSEGKSVKYVWVVAHYLGEQAKQVLAQARGGAGGYIVLEEGMGNVARSTLVAFRYVPYGQAIPHHLTVVTRPDKIAEYEQKIAARGGRQQRG